MSKLLSNHNERRIKTHFCFFHRDLDRTELLRQLHLLEEDPEFSRMKLVLSLINALESF